jgi:hypothetical protein
MAYACNAVPINFITVTAQIIIAKTLFKTVLCDISQQIVRRSAKAPVHAGPKITGIINTHKSKAKILRV